MKTNLSRDHRRILEATCAQARAAAEAGAERALHALAVGAKEAPGHQSDAQKKLRVRLRAHGRALGDELSQDNTQRIDSPPNESTALGRQHSVMNGRFQESKFHRPLFGDQIEERTVA